MASISKDPGRRKRVLFVVPDQGRKAIRLGKIPQRAAEAIKVKVEALLASKVSGCGWDNETAQCVANLPEDLADKLAAVGLIPRRGTATLDSFIQAYVESRKADLKPRTLMKLRTTHQARVAFFGAARNLREITAGDADEWRLHMLSQGLEPRTRGL